MNKRFHFIDSFRGLCVLYIVGFWHLLSYTSTSRWYYNNFTVRATVVALASFVLLSGFLLGANKANLNVRSFFQKRFFRIYPLFFIALLLFKSCGLVDRVTLLKGSLLIAMVYGPPPLTLWFICLIMLFYIIAPVLIGARNLGAFFLRASALYLGFALIERVSPTADPRLLIYFPAFASGIFFSKSFIPESPERTEIHQKHWWIILLAGTVLSAFISFHSQGIPETSYASIPLAIFVPILLFITFSRFFDRPATRLIKNISYAGFVMYLTHRPIYLGMSYIYEKNIFTFFAKSGIIKCCLLYSCRTAFSFHHKLLYSKSIRRSLPTLGRFHKIST